MTAESLAQIRKKLMGLSREEIIPSAREGEPVACVLVPFALHNEDLVILFTHRSNRVATHRGQVSFPGGMNEPVDRDFVETALRETEEEIGIDKKRIEIIGELKTFRSHTGLMIFPFVGFIKDLSGLRMNLDEVERIFCIPFDWLRNPANLHQEDYCGSNGEIHQVWTFGEYEGEKVWGITAEITRQLIDLS